MIIRNTELHELYFTNVSQNFCMWCCLLFPQFPFLARKCSETIFEWNIWHGLVMPSALQLLPTPEIAAQAIIQGNMAFILWGCCTWWFKAWISIFFLLSHRICTSFHPVSKLSSCSFSDCCWRSDSSWIHLGPSAISWLKSGSRLSISSLRSSCSFNIFSASTSDTGISSEATSIWVLFSL